MLLLLITTNCLIPPISILLTSAILPSITLFSLSVMGFVFPGLILYSQMKNDTVAIMTTDTRAKRTVMLIFNGFFMVFNLKQSKHQNKSL